MRTQLDTVNETELSKLDEDVLDKIIHQGIEAHEATTEGTLPSQAIMHPLQYARLKEKGRITTIEMKFKIKIVTDSEIPASQILLQ